MDFRWSDSYRNYWNLSNKKWGIFPLFYVFLHKFFAILTTFWRFSAKTHEFLASKIALLASILCCWCPSCFLYSCWLVSTSWHPCCSGSPFYCWSCDVPIVSAIVGLPPCCCRLHCFCIPAFDGMVLAVLLLFSFLLLLAFLLLGHDISVILKMLLVAGVTVVACVTAVACMHTDCGSHSCNCWRPESFWRFPVDSLSAITDVPGVTNGIVCFSAVPFKHAVAGGPAVTGFPAVEGVLAVANVPADPGVPILAVGFTYWIVEWDILNYRAIRLWLSDCNFFCYRTIGISYNVLVNSRNYRTIGYRIKACKVQMLVLTLACSWVSLLKPYTQPKL